MLIYELLHCPSHPISLTERELLLSKVLHCSREALYINDQIKLTSYQQHRLQTLIKRRLTGEPLAYILGYQNFWEQNLKINQNVLIPRPETELVVELALAKLGAKNNAYVADLGTGSGAIAIALALTRPTWNVMATDISSKALTLAKNNARRLKAANIKFKLGSWLQALPTKPLLDMIVANPPYIAPQDPYLRGSIRFEPRSALVAPQNGLADLKTIITKAPYYLKLGGWLIVEHGYNQEKEVKALFKNCKAYGPASIYLDYAKHPRVSAAPIKLRLNVADRECALHQ